ncbi:putative membrane protein [Methylobacterium sp. 1973]
MRLFEPDDFPPTLMDRLKAAGGGLFLLAVGSLMLWRAPVYADPSWTPSFHRMRYLMDWSPFWRGAHIAILGSWIVAFSLLAFWKALRPFTPRSKPLGRNGIPKP